MSSNTFSSKPSAWFKTKLFSLSLSLFSLILFSVLLVGCGSSGGGGGGSSSPKSSSNDMNNFSFTNTNKIIKPAVIKGQNVDITIEHVYSNPTPIVTHNGTKYSPEGYIDLTKATMPLHYNITAANGDVKRYYVTIRRAFIVSDEGGLGTAIDTIQSDIPSNKYVTILITKDLDLSGNERNITSAWANNNITLEKYNSIQDVTIKGLTIAGENIVTLDGVNVDKTLIIKSFTFDNSIVVKNATINGTHIDITVDYNATNATNSSLTPTVTHTGIDHFPKTPINFYDLPANYTVTGDGSTKSYSVIVRRGFVVSTAKELANAIDTINNDINSNNYTTILINNDINLAGATNRTIPLSWKERNIILENSNSTSSNVTIKWLTIEGNDTVGLKGVKLERVITAVAAGGWHSLTLDSEGKLWATGYNSDGQLGLGNSAAGTEQNSFQPVTIANLTSGTRIISVAAGTYHSLALDSDGKLWASGDNYYGQLGLGNSGAGTNQNSFQNITISGVKIDSIAAGRYHSLALDSNGKLWASGDNYNGQLGLGNTNSQSSFQPVKIDLSSSAKIVSIAAGYSHSLALDSNGKLWASGDNYNGQLGLSNYIDQNSFQSVTISGLAKNATIVSITAGTYHSLALDSSGKIWATGDNYYGQLGLGNSGAGTKQNSFQPVTIPNLPSNATIVSIAAGSVHSLSLDSNGKLWASGHNYYGQLGLGNFGAGTNQNSFQAVTIPNLAQNVNITSVSAGWYHSFALDSDGKLRATGYNFDGQLGFGDNMERNEFMPVPSSWSE